MEFPCDRCGLCCQSIKGIELYKDLDDGSGTCKYFDINTKLCTIYYQRPEKCDVKAMYRYFSNQFTFEEWIEFNAIACYELKKSNGEK